MLLLFMVAIGVPLPLPIPLLALLLFIVDKLFMLMGGINGFGNEFGKYFMRDSKEGGPLFGCEDDPEDKRLEFKLGKPFGPTLPKAKSADKGESSLK